MSEVDISAPEAVMGNDTGVLPTGEESWGSYKTGMIVIKGSPVDTYLRSEFVYKQAPSATEGVFYPTSKSDGQVFPGSTITLLEDGSYVVSGFLRWVAKLQLTQVQGAPKGNYACIGFSEKNQMWYGGTTCRAGNLVCCGFKDGMEVYPSVLVRAACYVMDTIGKRISLEYSCSLDLMTDPSGRYVVLRVDAPVPTFLHHRITAQGLYPTTPWVVGVDLSAKEAAVLYTEGDLRMEPFEYKEPADEDVDLCTKPVVGVPLGTSP